MNQPVPVDTAPSEHLDAREPRSPFRLFALKDHDTFMVADAFGDIVGAGDGLFHNDTRLISRLRLTLGGHQPSLLSAAVSQDNVFFSSHNTNQDLPLLGAGAAPHGVIHVERKRFLWDRRCYERLTFTNYGRDLVMAPVALEFDADFADMFEVRGSKRIARGRRSPARAAGRSVAFDYVGLDNIERGSVISFSEPPGRLTANRADFLFMLSSEDRFELYLEIGPVLAPAPCRERWRAAAAQARLDMRRRTRRGARVHSSGRLFNEWIQKSRADLALLTTELDTGPYPYAGIPWFSTPFGRDAIITAWQVLWIEPGLARGVLSYLARHQAMEISAFQDSAPGKIMHETRRGEMTTLGELPFGRYYGGVDTTPLFVALACAYAERTGDLDFVDALWPSLRKAIAWIEDFGDSDGDGLIDYARGADTGLSNQNWKDSEDSVFHADGRFPAGPIAVVEVQGYAFAAFKGMARLAERRGEAELAQGWLARAHQLRDVVESRFWMEDQQFYAMAIDGQGKPCEVRGSNAGHLLFSGLPSPDRAQAVIQTLLAPDFNAGWGIRTLAQGQPRYNPMSYHNGSIWPHDTGLCAQGMANYGERDGVVRLTAGLFETAASFEMRLPELFCGFKRAAGEPPVAYPVACLPQAWAAGSIFMMLQACLGVTVDGWTGAVSVTQPRLPIGIDRLEIEDLPLGAARVDIRFHQKDDQVEVLIVRKDT
ncbi:amylo-alpha-1,6-glucosidase [Caulobacter sp. FWC26]|jgi:glycogen debranching enzyme|uniref:amylo-alpha-1,6-glucosidase n=1 Tax=Caulobacter sp. FWC26 TaxID=69665 RepID=UPI000C14BAA9|nr:amylo-alpha-1,6-glucosidase [Caulobacter sp. FWC26]AZS20628.1 amylo-alpha-1,6-glucosidase [Caulobacter sp. FWC26]